MLGVFAIFTSTSFGQYTHFTVANNTTDIVTYRFVEVKGPGASFSDIAMHIFNIDPGQMVVFSGAPLQYSNQSNNAFIGFFECVWFPSSINSIGPGVGNGIPNPFITIIGSWVIPFLPHNTNNANSGEPSVGWLTPNYVVIYS